MALLLLQFLVFPRMPLAILLRVPDPRLLPQEGQALGNPAAKRGYSRDSRPDCKQVVVGLVVGRRGFPKAHEVFDGDRADSTTVEEMLQILEDRAGRQNGALVVVDRGMAYDHNLDYNADAGQLTWIENSQRKQVAETLDGSYLLKTNRKGLQGEDIWRLYSLLTRAENGCY